MDELIIWYRTILTAAKWHRVIVNPMARGTDPLTSLLFSSTHPWMTKTSIKVMTASTRSPCRGVKSSLTVVSPSPPTTSTGVITCKDIQKYAVHWLTVIVKWRSMMVLKQRLYSVRGLELSELGGSHGCPIHSAPSLGQIIVMQIFFAALQINNTE